jgi:hypothetical protein
MRVVYQFKTTNNTLLSLLSEQNLTYSFDIEINQSVKPHHVEHYKYKESNSSHRLHDVDGRIMQPGIRVGHKMKEQKGGNHDPKYEKVENN